MVRIDPHLENAYEGRPDLAAIHPTIVVKQAGWDPPALVLTWDEARNLAAALLQVEGIARNG